MKMKMKIMSQNLTEKFTIQYFSNLLIAHFSQADIEQERSFHNIASIMCSLYCLLPSHVNVFSIDFLMFVS